jgi:hypothetical protein
MNGTTVSLFFSIFIQTWEYIANTSWKPLSSLQFSWSVEIDNVIFLFLLDSLYQYYVGHCLLSEDLRYRISFNLKISYKNQRPENGRRAKTSNIARAMNIDLRQYAMTNILLVYAIFTSQRLTSILIFSIVKQTWDIISAIQVMIHIF